MFEMFFLMLAVAAHSTGQGGSPVNTTGLAITGGAAAVTATAPLEAAEAPAFLAPKPNPVAPSFLAPKPAPATPTFLAPKPAPATPTFLAPKPAPATPTFLAPAPSGPVLTAEPQIPSGRFTTAVEVKPILNATRGNWIAVREYNGQDLIYVTHLWAWRCGLLELRVGINGAPPAPWPLPACHLDKPAPNMVLETDGLPYRAYGLGSIAMIEVQITYDDLTTDSAKFNRQGVQIP